MGESSRRSGKVSARCEKERMTGREENVRGLQEGDAARDGSERR